MLITCIKFETVNAVVGLEAIEFLFKPGHRSGIAEVEDRADAVPPLHRLAVFACRIADRLEKDLVLLTSAINVAVLADEGADPEHDFESHAVQFVHHRFGCRETGAMKIPFAIIFVAVGGK